VEFFLVFFLNRNKLIPRYDIYKRKKLLHISSKFFFHLALNLKAVFNPFSSAFRILRTVPQTFPHFWIPHFTFRIPHSAIPHFTNTPDLPIAILWPFTA